MDERPRRPALAVVLALVLFLLGGLTIASGILLSEISNCCGSSEPTDDTPTLVGFAVGLAMAVAGRNLWKGDMPAAFVIVPTAALPVMLAVLAPHSMDSSNLLPFAVPLWVLLAIATLLPPLAPWMTRCPENGRADTDVSNGRS